MYSDDYQNQPYWWRSTPRPILDQVDLPQKSDVVIVGSGYTGLNAALQTVRAGRSTTIIEAKQCGYGCSSRNGGQIGTSFKPSLRSLQRKFGHEIAIKMIGEGHRALKYLKDLIHDENFDCDLSSSGRFIATHSKRAFEGIAKAYSELPSEIAINHYMVPNSEQRGEIGSDRFYGGCVLPDHGSIHPGKYHAKLLTRVMDSGAIVIDQCPVTAIESIGSEFRVRTAKGNIVARDVVLATNGYTDKQFQWHARRVLPIGSFQIATEELDRSLIDQLIPHNRVISDTQLIGNYFRLSPDHSRLLFGGRVTFMEAESESGIHTLRKQMTDVFPQLTDTKIANAWVGYVAYTLDISPHIGQQDGIYYSMGYCGSGITLSSYFGMRIGQKLLGTDEGRTELDHLKFPTLPGFIRNRMFLFAATNTLRVAERFF